MSVLSLNGSPHKEGDTTYLLKKVLDQVTCEKEIIDLHDCFDNVPPFCLGCPQCTAFCYTNTKIEEVFNKMRKAKVIILGSPVYFGTISAQMKALFDKTRLLRSQQALLGKYGAAVSVGHSLFGGQEGTARVLQEMMLVHGMTIIGDGAADLACGHRGVCAKSPAIDDQNALTRCEALASRINSLC